jgi:peptidoglycan/xylan/chitin deacetylase (PgdA/CDA1 family)
LLASRDFPGRIDLQLDGYEIHWRPGAGDEERRAAHAEAWRVLRTLTPARRDDAVERIAAACGVAADDGCRPLSSNELRELDRHPSVEIGAHTASHPVLAELEHEEQRGEILGGKRDLERMLGHPVQLFSYPHGQTQDFTPETVELVRDSGFSLACSAVGGLVTGDSDVYRLPRVAIPDWDGATFDRRLEELLR